MQKPLDMEAMAKEYGIDVPTLGETAAHHALTIARLRDAMTLASARLQTNEHRADAMRAARLVLDKALSETR
jgi:hypothetical protein